MVYFSCPKCHEQLNIKDKTYLCKNNHCYDISKHGYVNLLPLMGPNRRHGDDKMMLLARTNFLSKGYYNKLSDEIVNMSLHYSNKNVNILDAGCGEGKYTLDVLNALKGKNIDVSMVATDISKDALISINKKSKDVLLAAASSSNLPFLDNTFDILLNIFSPLISDEFCRVIKPNGMLIRAIPLENHLFELKELIYDKPYKNKVNDLEICGFKIEEEKNIKYQINLDNNEDIENLFKMTPYYYKTSKADQEKILTRNNLNVRLEFKVIAYMKRKLI